MTEGINKRTEETKESARGFLNNLINLVKEIFDVKDEIDRKGTAEHVKKDVIFKGFNIWILILSILICCIGLNLNSTAVIIGAMLISPLMGPITGIGFAIGTFNRDLLFLALKNFAIAVVISMVVSYTFFLFAPEGHELSELISRTSPGVMDLLVALFGGFAGILAGTRGSRTNVIPGVAIATALMPPLCTAGYGLANHDMSYFLGASYLFFINSVFISLAALLVVRYLRFPIASYISPQLERRGKIFIVFFVILIAVPSFFIYSKAVRKSSFERKAREFVNSCVHNENHSVINPQIEFGDTLSSIKLFVFGQKYTDHQIDSIKLLMSDYGLENTHLEIHNMGTFDLYKDLFREKEDYLSQTKSINNQLGIEITHLSHEKNYLNSQLDYIREQRRTLEKLDAEALVLFPSLEHIDYGLTPMSDSLNQWITTVFLRFDPKTRTSQRRSDFDRIDQWLNAKYENLDSLRIMQVN